MITSEATAVTVMTTMIIMPAVEGMDENERKTVDFFWGVLIIFLSVLIDFRLCWSLHQHPIPRAMLDHFFLDRDTPSTNLPAETTKGIGKDIIFFYSPRPSPSKKVKKMALSFKVLGF